MSKFINKFVLDTALKNIYSIARCFTEMSEHNSCEYLYGQ
jgi:hypothetical protein